MVECMEAKIYSIRARSTKGRFGVKRMLSNSHLIRSFSIIHFTSSLTLPLSHGNEILTCDELKEIQSAL